MERGKFAASQRQLYLQFQLLKCPPYFQPVPVQPPVSTASGGGRTEEVIELADSDSDSSSSSEEGEGEEEKTQNIEPVEQPAAKESAVEYGEPGRKRKRVRAKSEKSVQSNKVDSSGLKATPPHSGPDETNRKCTKKSALLTIGLQTLGALRGGCTVHCTDVRHPPEIFSRI